jgi:lipoprotein-releasing system ATP-binding protein
MSEPVLILERLVRRFEQGGQVLEVLRGIDFRLHPGEMVGLIGPSGAGKSTLLHAAGLLERPDGGRVVIDGTDAGRADDSVRTRLRRATIGFVYQFHHLLPEFSAIENVMMPQLLAGQSRSKARARAAELLELMGLSARADHRPARLSGGEQQRVAIARALANRPRLLLADEPTGNLDPETAERVFGLLVAAARDQGVAALIATHNPELAARMDRRVRLDQGRLDHVA